MDEKIIIRKAKLNDFSDVHKLIMQVHKLHVSKRNDIYKGIGKKLYNQIVQLAKENNIDNIELMVWGFNENAIKFYKNLGMNIKNLKFERKIYQ